MHGTRAVPICMRIRGRFWMGACVVCFCQSRCTSSCCAMVLSGIDAAYHHDMVMVVARSFIIVGRVDGWMDDACGRDKLECANYDQVQLEFHGCSRGSNNMLRN